MATVNEKMTALADEIRELSGTTATKGIDTMTSDVNTANAEIAEQAELLVQIATALEGKAAGGSGEDVTAETTAYTTKIGQLETAVAALETELEGKASGGSCGSVETCTVTIEGYSASTTLYGYSATTYTNGKIGYSVSIYNAASPNNVSLPYTIENVVLGTVIQLDISSTMFTVDGAERLGGNSSGQYFKITASEGEMVTITGD